MATIIIQCEECDTFITPSERLDSPDGLLTKITIPPCPVCMHNAWLKATDMEPLNDAVKKLKSVLDDASLN